MLLLEFLPDFDSMILLNIMVIHPYFNPVAAPEGWQGGQLPPPPPPPMAFNFFYFFLFLYLIVSSAVGHGHNTPTPL